MRRPNWRKRFRFKFTQNQKESLSEFAQRAEWKLQKRDEEQISEFCGKIGVQDQVFKVWLHNKKKNTRRATADILPGCLVQKILCYLSFKEATKMSIPSKTWFQAWLTLPNLEFKVDYPKGKMKRVDNIMERYRKGKIPIEKFELSQYFGNSRKVFPKIDKWLDIALQNGVKELVLDIISYPLPIFQIFAAKSLAELVLKCCYLMPVSLSSGVVNCNSLRKLSLSHVTLDENMLQLILNSCPLIVSFILGYCSGLLNLQTIKSVSLKDLKIRYCGGIWEIDAPNLISLEYTWNQIPELKFARESSQLKHSKIILHCFHKLNAAWFCKLRKFLSNSTSWSQVHIYSSRYNEINMNDLQLDHRVAIPQVDVLDVDFSWKTRECPAFVDALLWSCHPKRLDLQSTRKIFTFFIDRLMYMDNSSQFTSHGSKSWYSQLQEVKAYKFDRKNQSWHPVEHKRGKLTRRNLEERDRYYFLLDW